MKQAEVVWALAHDGPMTAKEIGEWMPDDIPTAGRYSRTVQRAWRNGLLVRRKRNNGGHAKNPYEYAVAPPPQDRETESERDCVGSETDT